MRLTALRSSKLAPVIKNAARVDAGEIRATEGPTAADTVHPKKSVDARPHK